MCAGPPGHEVNHQRPTDREAGQSVAAARNGLTEQPPAGGSVFPQEAQYRKAWTSYPSLTEPGLDRKEAGVRKVVGSLLLRSALCDHELTQSPVFKCLGA